MNHRLSPGLAVLLLAACTERAAHAPPTEVVQAAPLVMAVEAQGELRAVTATPLTVPGENWADRQLVWMQPEGSLVHAGEVIARFTAEAGKVELAATEFELQRVALQRAAKQAELATSDDRVQVDLAQVATDLGIAQRYAHADLGMFARNQVLDAVQDVRYLEARRGVLEWRHAETGRRAAAELGVLDAQRATQALSVETHRKDLAALELIAPHDGVLMLATDWSGEKPRIGQQMWAGSEFGSLPDVAELDVQLGVPQIEAGGLKLGLEVSLHPLGRPGETITTRIGWVAAAAQPQSRDSPVKYVAARAPVPAEAVARLRLVPGQRFAATMYLERRERGLSVPNVALLAEGDATYVVCRNGHGYERRKVTLGTRGPARSEVTGGLAEGDEIVLTPNEVQAG